MPRTGWEKIRRPGEVYGIKQKALSRMKILLVANYLPDQQQSMNRFAELLSESLKEFNFDVTVIRPEPVFCFTGQSGRGISKWLGYLDKFIIFPSRLREAVKKVDIVHICDHSNAFYINQVINKPHVITCHDLLAVRSALGEFPQNPTGFLGRIFQMMIWKSLQKARHVVCDSEATFRDLLRLSKSDGQRSWVIPPGLNYSYVPMDGAQSGEILSQLGIDSNETYFLHVGNNSWYKNRRGLLGIFSALIQKKYFSHGKLLIAGRKLSSELKRLAVNLKIDDKIIEIENPTNVQLQALYSRAWALIHPSFAEGFGWPILEAQACGCPVFTTNKPPMTEVGGSAAGYIDPIQLEQAVETIAGYLNNHEMITEMKRKGILNAKKNDSQSMLSAYLKIYDVVKGDYETE